MQTASHTQPLTNIGVAILLLDADGYIQQANAAALAVTGYNADDLLHKPLKILYPNTDSVKSNYELDTARKNGTFSVQGWRVKQNGYRFWAETILAAEYTDNRQLEGYSCVILDRTRSKEHELALQQSEERYRLLIEGVKDYAIFLMDTRGYVQTWNEGAQRIKGYAPNEIIGKHFSTFYTAGDLLNDKPQKELKIARETGKYEEEGWRVKKSGGVFWANIVITALFNDQNKLVGFAKVTRDLTHGREQQEALRQSEERYRSLVEQIADYGIFMMDEKGRIVSWNEGARKIKGYTAEEIIGKYFSVFFTEEDTNAGKPASELKIAASEGRYEEEGWRVRKDGSRFWASVVITPMYNPHQELIGFSKVTRDLTERKEAEKKLRDSYENYRHIARELEITNRELYVANQELENFASVASHDLQEPLRAIRSFLQLIDMKLQAGQTDELKTYVDKSATAANRMQELIHNLLYYTQVGKGEAIMETLQVDELISNTLLNLKNSIETSGADVVVDNEVTTVKGDRVQLTQLFQNLVSNALKFTDGRQPVVKIEGRKAEGAVRFSVTDNGIGIARENQNKVFEIFKRLNAKTKYPGTGIGLSICKKIVEQHQGKIWLQSAVGRGTTFYFTLNENRKGKP